MSIKIICGDSLEVLKTLEENSVDSICCDPPYGLSFMGKKWDYDVPKVELWKEAIRVLKPGGHALVACGTRTQHRMAVNIEDAGFEIRDSIEFLYDANVPFQELCKTLSPEQLKLMVMALGNDSTVIYAYGSGFPKSHNLGKSVDKLQGNEREVTGDNPNHRPNSPKDNAKGDFNPNSEGNKIITKNSSPYEGWGTALKPAHENWIMARKPLSESTIAENVLRWQTGGINIDATRIPSYTNGDNSENIVLSHKLFELRGKLHTLLLSCEVGKKDCPIPSSADGYVQSWKELQDCLAYCSTCRGLYDELSPLFLKGDQVSVQQLHDVHGGISHYLQEQNGNLSGQGIDHPANLDDFLQLILLYLNDTTLYIKKQEITGWSGGKRRGNTGVTAGASNGGKQGGFNYGGGEARPTQGRFPANLILDGSDEVVGLFPESKSGNGKATTYEKEGGQWGKGKQIRNADFGDSGSASRFFKTCPYEEGEGASFAYFPKASKKERYVYLTCNCQTVKLESWPKQDQNLNEQTGGTSPEADTYDEQSEVGLFSNTSISGKKKTEKSLSDTHSITSTTSKQTTDSAISSSSMPLNTSESTEDVNLEMENGGSLAQSVKNSSKLQPTTGISPQKDGHCTGVVVPATLAGSYRKSVCVDCGSEVRHNGHPTQKPTSLMRYLVRLVTPKGGTVLDPFTGSGSTGKACVLEGFDFIGIELEADYCKIAEARINHTLSSLDKSLTDKEIEEMPQMKGTLEALDKLTIIK